MKKTRNIFYIITGLYIILTLVFILTRDTFFDRMGRLAYTNFLQFWLILGIIILVTVIIVTQFQMRKLESRNRLLEGEVAKIKVTLYDMEHKTPENDSSMRAFGDSIKSNPKKLENDSPDLNKPEV